VLTKVARTLLESKLHITASPLVKQMQLVNEVIGSNAVDLKMNVKESTAAGKLESSSGTAKFCSHSHVSPMDGSKEMVEEKASSARHSEDDNGQELPSNSFFLMNSGLLPFPEKLMSLLDGKCDTVSDAMWWLPDGDAFCLIPSVFTERVLDKHFQGTKFDSWTRKLNRWYVLLLLCTVCVYTLDILLCPVVSLLKGGLT
jgi:hypothetical protein